MKQWVGGWRETENCFVAFKEIDIVLSQTLDIKCR